MEDGEEHAAVLRHPPALADALRVDPHQRVLGKGREGVVGLVRQDVAVGQEQDARPPRRLAAEVPAAVEQLPGDLKGDGGLAGARRSEEHTSELQSLMRISYAVFCLK